MAGETGRVVRARSWMTSSVALVFSFDGAEPLKVLSKGITWPDLSFKDDLSGCK